MSKTATRSRAKKPATPAAAPAPTPAGKPRNLTPDELVMSAPVMAAAAMEPWAKGPFGNMDLGELVKGVREKVNDLAGGEMRSVEAMLYGQAKVLDTIFVNLARRAANQEYLTQFQAHLGLALKAQAASRATLQALAEVKNPRAPTFVRQTNVAHGPQQVNNNASPAASPARTEEAAAGPNKLLEASTSGGGLGPDLAGAADRGELQEVVR